MQKQRNILPSSKDSVKYNLDIEKKKLDIDQIHSFLFKKISSHAEVLSPPKELGPPGSQERPGPLNNFSTCELNCNVFKAVKVIKYVE